MPKGALQQAQYFMSPDEGGGAWEFILRPAPRGSASCQHSPAQLYPPRSSASLSNHDKTQHASTPLDFIPMQLTSRLTTSQSRLRLTSRHNTARPDTTRLHFMPVRNNSQHLKTPHVDALHPSTSEYNATRRLLSQHFRPRRRLAPLRIKTLLGFKASRSRYLAQRLATRPYSTPRRHTRLTITLLAFTWFLVRIRFEPNQDATNLGFSSVHYQPPQCSATQRITSTLFTPRLYATRLHRIPVLFTSTLSSTSGHFTTHFDMTLLDFISPRFRHCSTRLGSSPLRDTALLLTTLHDTPRLHNRAYATMHDGSLLGFRTVHVHDNAPRFTTRRQIKSNQDTAVLSPRRFSPSLCFL